MYDIVQSMQDTKQGSDQNGSPSTDIVGLAARRLMMAKMAFCRRGVCRKGGRRRRAYIARLLHEFEYGCKSAYSCGRPW